LLNGCKSKTFFGANALDIAKKQGRLETLINVLKTLMEKSDYELEMHVNISMIVTANGLENKQCHKKSQWLLIHSEK
jgi:hypothetical protein